MKECKHYHQEVTNSSFRTRVQSCLGCGQNLYWWRTTNDKEVKTLTTKESTTPQR